MKSFIYKVLFLYLSIITTYSILTYNWVPTNYKNHNLGAAYDKLELLANKKSPRILFSGGSSCSFGIDTEKIRGYSILMFIIWVCTLLWVLNII